MTVQELRANALGLLRLALKAGENGQIADAERLTAQAAQYFDDADVDRGRRPAADRSREQITCYTASLVVSVSIPASLQVTCRGT